MKQGLLIFIGITFLTSSVIFSTITFAQLREKEIMNEARFQCAQSSKYSVNQTNGVAVWYPVEELYNKCLEEKGVE